MLLELILLSQQPLVNVVVRRFEWLHQSQDGRGRYSLLSGCDAFFLATILIAASALVATDKFAYSLSLEIRVQRPPVLPLIIRDSRTVLSKDRRSSFNFVHIHCFLPALEPNRLQYCYQFLGDVFTSLAIILLLICCMPFVSVRVLLFVESFICQQSLPRSGVAGCDSRVIGPFRLILPLRCTRATWLPTIVLGFR